MLVSKYKPSKRSKNKIALKPKETEDRFRIMADGISFIIWVTDPDGRIKFVNRTYCEFFGITLEEVQEFGWHPLLHPKDSEAYIGDYKKALQERKPFHVEARVRRADGEWRWIDSSAEPFFSQSGEFSGMVGSSPDITERKEMELRIQRLLEKRSKQLQDYQTNFALLVNTMAEGIVVVDNNGCVLFGNPAASAIFNLTQNELAGYHLGIPASLGITEIELPIERQINTIELNSVEVIWHGQQGYLVTLRDITRRKRAEQMVTMLSHRLVESQEKERQEIGHELHDEVGGSLTAVKMALGRAKRKLGHNSDLELKRIEDIVDETMDTVSTLSQNMRPDILSDFGLTEALEWYFERYTRRTGINVHFKQKPAIKRYAGTIETTAYRIIQEALTNVARYAGVKEVTMGVHDDSEKLYIQIEDRGRGFVPQKVGEAPGGISGMQDRAFLVGGELIVDSSPGKGTRISCELPLIGH